VIRWLFFRNRRRSSSSNEREPKGKSCVCIRERWSDRER